MANFDTNWSDRWMKNGRYMLAAMLEVEAPLIWCLNGPVTVHPEFWFGACDIVLADPSAIAAQLMTLSPLTLKYSRFSINSRLRREAFLDTHPSYGMLGVAALEMFGPKREPRP